MKRQLKTNANQKNEMAFQGLRFVDHARHLSADSTYVQDVTEDLYENSPQKKRSPVSHLRNRAPYNTNMVTSFLQPATIIHLTFNIESP